MDRHFLAVAQDFLRDVFVFEGETSAPSTRVAHVSMFFGSPTGEWTMTWAAEVSEATMVLSVMANSVAGEPSSGRAVRRPTAATVRLTTITYLDCHPFGRVVSQVNPSCFKAGLIIIAGRHGRRCRDAARR